MENKLSDDNGDSLLMQQRKLRQDLRIGDHPLSDKLFRYYRLLVKTQLCFVFGWFILTNASPFAGESIIKLLSPLANIVFFFHSHSSIENRYFGSLSPDFYRSIVGETLFVALLQALLLGAAYIVRYRAMPWRFSQFVLEQLGTKATWLSAMILLLILLPLAALLGFMILAWYGFIPYIEAAKPLALHQLALWSTMASGVLGILVFFLLIFLSTILMILKKLLTFQEN